MLEDDVVLPPKKDWEWDCIQGYTSNVNCPICKLDILVKTGVLTDNHPAIHLEVIWSLCHVCFDKGWKIPRVSLDQGKLVYTNYRTREVRLVDLR